MIAATGLTMRRGGTAILDGCDFTVRPGEVVALIGPNGAGKSTLLELLSGAARPDAGTVRLEERPLEAWNARALARKRAVLPQAVDLAFPFRCLDVVLLGRDPHRERSSPSADLAVAEAALSEVDCAGLADRIYASLSGGERQRVQLARVLAQIWPAASAEERRYLLLDEPTNNLDIAHQLALAGTARRFADGGAGVLAVLHDPNLAAMIADRLAVLKAGRLVADGAPNRVLTPELLADAFHVRAEVIAHSLTGTPHMLPAPNTSVAGRDGQCASSAISDDQQRRHWLCSSP